MSEGLDQTLSEESRSSALSISDAQTVEAEIAFDGEQDFYRLELDAGLLYTFSISAVSIHVDLDWALYDDTGQEISRHDRLVHGDSLSLIPQSDGAYYLGVTADQLFQKTGGYSLSISEGVAVPDDDYGDEFRDATPIAINSTVNGFIGSPSDSDMFSIELQGGVKYVISSSEDNGLDAALSLYDRGYQLLERDIDGAGNGSDDALIGFTPDHDGVYYIQMADRFAQGSPEFEYSLEVRSTASNDDHGDFSTAATLVAASSVTTGVINEVGDVDVFRYYGTSESEINLNVGSGASLHYEIYDADAAFQSLWNLPVPDFQPYSADNLYFIVVQAGDEQPVSPISYELVLDAELSRETLAMAETLTVGTLEAELEKNYTISPANGEIGPFFRADLEAGRQYSIVSATPDNARVFWTLDIYDENGVPLERLSVMEDGAAEFHLEYRPLESGAYYFKVNDWFPRGGRDWEGSFSITERESYYVDFLATSIVFDDSIISGVINSSNDIDSFDVHLLAGHQYSFQVTENNGLDATLTLLDAGGLVALDDNSGLRDDPLISFLATETGRYTLEVTDANGRGSADFDYQLAISAGYYLPDDDHANNSAGASNLVLGEATSGVIAYNGDSDFFSVELRAGQSYLFELLEPYDLDATLSLFGVDGDLLVFDDNSGLRDDPQIVFTAEQDGEYFLEVADVRGWGDPTYSFELTVDALPEPVEDDYHDTTADAAALVVGGSVNGVIGAFGDVDVFAVELTAGRSYAFEVIEPYDLDATLTLRDSEEVQLAFDDNSGLRDDPLIIFNAEKSGTYYVEVEDVIGRGDPTYSYELTVLESELELIGVSSPSNLVVV